MNDQTPNGRRQNRVTGTTSDKYTDPQIRSCKRHNGLVHVPSKTGSFLHKCNRHGPRPVQPPYPMFPSWKPPVHFMCPTPRHSTLIQVANQSNNPLPTSCSPRPAPSRPSQSWFRRHRKCDWISHRRVGPANEAYACFLPASLHAEGSGSSKHGGGGSEKH
jgi:hypothetical protein